MCGSFMKILNTSPFHPCFLEIISDMISSIIITHPNSSKFFTVDVPSGVISHMAGKIEARSAHHIPVDWTWDPGTV